MIKTMIAHAGWGFLCADVLKGQDAISWRFSMELDIKQGLLNTPPPYRPIFLSNPSLYLPIARFLIAAV